MGAAKAPGRPLQFGAAGFGFFSHFAQSASGNLRQPCKNGKNHSPSAPHFRSRPCPANAVDIFFISPHG
jgi:hypothetical protein